MGRYSQLPRLVPSSRELISRNKMVELKFGRHTVEAFEGDTIASALYGAGFRIFSRGFKYHRARGLLCVSGNCPNCLMKVDGIPNVRACLTRIEQGMKVEHQNAWPTLNRDLFSLIDRLDWALPIGFYYKTMHRPRALWSISSALIRRVAGLGRLDSIASESLPTEYHRFQQTNVAVVGGGPAGLSAALAAANSGVDVTLVDEQSTLGGHLRFENRMRTLGGEESRNVISALSAKVEAHERVQVILDATVIGRYEDNLLGISTPGGLIHLRAQSIIAATGSLEVPLTFERNDLAGVMLGTGIQRLINLYRLKPGQTALVATTNDQGYYTALDLLEAGVRVAAIADTRPEFPSDFDAAVTLKGNGVLVLPGHAIVRAEGTRTVIGGVVAAIEADMPTTKERQFDCDLIAMSGGFQPANYILRQSDVGIGFDSEFDEPVPISSSTAIRPAGDVTGFHNPHVATLQGRLAGLSVAKTLGMQVPVDTISQVEVELRNAETTYRDKVQVRPAPIDSEAGVKQFVCFCEDVTLKDVVQGVGEGFADIQTLKRYSTTTMGPCQGKMCHKRFVEIVSDQTGMSPDEVGSTTARPPIQPVTLGTLAGPGHMAWRRTPIHNRHLIAGAKIIETGGWQRPHSYGDPHDEAKAVRERVGIIDVSTLGKLDVRGVDAGQLLDFVYTHRFSDLRPGRVRYGLMTGDNGTIMDDGTVARLTDDRYYITTSTANVETVEQWFKWWMADRQICAHVTNITAGYCAINVAGPDARATLAKLTDVELEPKKFRYMQVKSGQVGGIPAMLLRIGFVGESGWEIHVPSEYGEEIWNALLTAGEEFGITPFGVEAQRILRLEKMHIIPSQDTDILTTPFDISADWAVKFDKGDFVGSGGLRIAKERGVRDILVGFKMRGSAVPNDGDAVVSESGLPIGRITSARLSPTMGTGFGYARVPVEVGVEGGVIHIRVNGINHLADVTLRPFYDPDGVRLRE